MLPALTGCALISAYDVHYAQLPDPSTSSTTFPEILVLDSGGYEIGTLDDLSTPFHVPGNPQPWSLEFYEAILARWPPRIAAAFVSYDHPRERHPVRVQIDAAKALFGRHPGHLRTFLVKPTTRDQRTLETALADLRSCVEDLACFDIIGVTEKELGTSLLGRMTALAKLRMLMDHAGVSAPIHVFGSLDPLTSCLLFAAGAEIFDGLTWLRFAFHNGCAIYKSNFGALITGAGRRDDFVEHDVLLKNLDTLGRLASTMRTFTLDHDFKRFGEHHVQLQSAYEQLRVALGAGGR